MGYVLPWGQMSYWGATVITNLFSAIPGIGGTVAQWLWGGFSVANATLTRFFSLHYLLPFILAGLVIVHIVLLHLGGSTNPLSVLKFPDKIAFYPYFYVKDYVGFVFIAVSFISVVVYWPDWLGHSDNYIVANSLVTPLHIVPEWYFLPFYAILRSIPSKLGGVILMALSIGVLVFLPFVRGPVYPFMQQGRVLYNFFFWLFFVTVVLLGYLGGQPIEDPYVTLAQVLTGYYFFFFFAIVAIEKVFSSHILLYNQDIDATS
jgi:ubiquinol-cytochrome c reductase cytochrome b subunit